MEDPITTMLAYCLLPLNLVLIFISFPCCSSYINCLPTDRLTFEYLYQCLRVTGRDRDELCFGAGDFVICIHLAHSVWRDCREASENSWTVFTAVASLQVVLKEVQEAANDHEPSETKEYGLSKLIGGWNDVSQELHGLLNKYLGMQRRRTWDRIRWI